MNAPRQAKLAEPLLQLLVVMSVAALVYSGLLPSLSALALLVLVAVWPPRVRWSPVAAVRVIAAYVPFGLAWYAFTFLYLHCMHALGVTIAPQATLEGLATQGTALPDFAAVVLSIVVLAPLLEEIVFRGYLFTALDLLLPRIGVHLVTAAAFGLVHGWHYALPIGVLALLFGWLRARHQALLPSMFAHALHNGLTVVLTLAWPGHLEFLYPR